MRRTIGFTTIALGATVCCFVLIVRMTSALHERAWPQPAEGKVPGVPTETETSDVRGEPAPHMMHASITTGGAAFGGGGVALIGQPLAGTCANQDYKLTVGAVPGLLAPRFGDFDRNLRINLPDYRDFTLCLSGPGVEAVPACPRGDADRDADVDLKDLARFTQVFTGGS